MSNTKITQHVIADDAITTSMITDANITPAKLHGTLDLSSKTLTIPAVAIPSASTATTQSASDNSTKVATTAYVETAISNLVDSSPSSLNTLNELAAALNDDASFSSTVTTSLAAKAPLANPTFTTAINGGDNVKIQLGASQDLQIFHDGTHSRIKDAGSGNLTLNASNFVLNNSGDTQNMVTGVDGGAVTLYHAGSAKLVTTATGVTLSGTGALVLPQGTTGQRPSAATGQLRWNTTDGALEVYNGSAWTAVGTGSSNKILDTFTGDNSTTDFTLSVTPANEDALMVFIDGVYQEKGDYALTNAVLALDTAPASGEKIAVHITTASVHDGTSATNQQFTATAGQTAFTLSADPKSENNTQVYINGVYQQKTDYTVSGTTLTFDTGLTVGDVVEVNAFTVATLGNTDTVTEGTTNLYHTTARARSAISVSGNALSYNSSTGVITSAYEESPSFTGDVTVTSGTSSKPHLNIINTNADSSAPVLNFKKDSSSPGDNDEVGRIYMYGDDDAGNATEAFLAIGKMTDVSNGSEDSSLDMYTYKAGAQKSTLTMKQGNIGIGTTGPLAQLEIDPPAVDTPILAIRRQDSASIPLFKFFQDSSISQGTGHAHMNTGNRDLSITTDTNSTKTNGIYITATGGYVGVGDSNPQHKLKVHLTNGQIAMFGSNNMNSPGNYAGIGLGQVIANGTTHQKVSLVTEGRNSGSYVQDFHILVDTAGDSGSAVLSDSKLKIDGGHGAVTLPGQPAASVRGSGGWSGTLSAATWTPMQGTATAYNNQGGHFNTSTKRFTAPVAGYYLCHSSSYIRWSSSTQSYGAQYIHPAHFKNGASNWANSDHPYLIIGHTLDGSSTGYVDGVERTDIIYCSAGDYLEWRFYTHGSHWEVYGNYQHSSYYLLG